MYTLSRIPVVKKSHGIEYEYHFDIVNIFNDKLVCRLKVYNRKDSNAPVTMYDFVVRDTDELNDLYNNPSYAVEYMSKEALGHRFVYFEFVLPDEKHSFSFRESHEKFMRYVQLRHNFSKFDILVKQCSHSSDRFSWTHLPEDQEDCFIYKGYAFINVMWDPEEFCEFYKDEIRKQINQFKTYEIGD